VRQQYLTVQLSHVGTAVARKNALQLKLPTTQQAIHLAVKIQLVEVSVGDISHGQSVNCKTNVLLLASDLYVMPLTIVQ